MNDASIAIVERIQKSDFWNSKSKNADSYLRNLTCPECGKSEAWTYKEAPYKIFCQRLNHCGAAILTRDLFPDLFNKIDNTEDYLHSRGLSKSLKGLNYETWKNIRNTGCDGVMFQIDTNTWNGRIINPIPGVDKNHNKGKIAGKYWKHPGFNNLYLPIYITEGIIDALSLIEMGFQAISILSANSDPEKIDLKDFKKNLVFAFDNDKAGINALKRWKKKYPKANAIIPAKNKDWNDFLLGKPIEKAKKEFTENLEEMTFKADLALAEKPEKYAEIWYNYKEKILNHLEFDGCFWRIISEKQKDNNFSFTAFPISNFTVEVEYFKLDKTEGNPSHTFFLKLTPKNGDSHIYFTATGRELSTISCLKEMFLTRGKVYWKGDQNDSNWLCEKLTNTKVKTVRQFDKVGYDHESGYYVFNHFAIDKKGNRITPEKEGFYKVGFKDYVNPVSYGNLIKPDIISSSDAFAIELFKLIAEAWNEQGITALVWMIASWVVNQIKDKIAFFPFLSLYGDTQTGKSRLIQLLNRMQCIDEEGLSMSKLNTGKGELRKLSQRSGIFQAMLESQGKTIRFDISNILTLYNANSLQTTALKTLDNRTRELPFYSNLAFVQNREPFEGRAQKERIISLCFSRDSINENTTKAFNELEKISMNKLACFFPIIMKHREKIESEWYNNYQKKLQFLREKFTDPRITENHALILTFHDLLCSVLEINYDLSEYIEKICKKKIDVCQETDIDLADSYFCALDSLSECSEDKYNQCIKIDKTKKELYLNLSNFKKHCREEKFISSNDKDIETAFLKHRSYIRRDRIYFSPGKQCRVLVFNIDKLSNI
jgi:hypothetical protein